MVNILEVHKVCGVVVSFYNYSGKIWGLSLEVHLGSDVWKLQIRWEFFSIIGETNAQDIGFFYGTKALEQVVGLEHWRWFQMKILKVFSSDNVYE